MIICLCTLMAMVSDDVMFLFSHGYSFIYSLALTL